MLPIRYGGCLLRSTQCSGTGAASREGQSSAIILSRENIRPYITNVKLIVFIKIINNSNGKKL
jgi:hypothetical protein